MYVIQSFERCSLSVLIVKCFERVIFLSTSPPPISISVYLSFPLFQPNDLNAFLSIHAILASSHFFWTASHAIGSYSAVSSRTNTPNPYCGQQQHVQMQQQQQSQQICRKEEFAGIILFHSIFRDFNLCLLLSCQKAHLI